MDDTMKKTLKKLYAIQNYIMDDMHQIIAPNSPAIYQKCCDMVADLVTELEDEMNPKEFLEFWKDLQKDWVAESAEVKNEYTHKEVKTVIL